MNRLSFLKTLLAPFLALLVPGIHFAQTRKYTGYNDYDGVPIRDGDTVEIESGASFIGGKHGDKTLHKIEWCPDYGSWVMIGMAMGYSGRPSKNELNSRWVDRQFITARCYPLRVV